MNTFVSVTVKMGRRYLGRGPTRSRLVAASSRMLLFGGAAVTDQIIGVGGIGCPDT